MVTFSRCSLSKSFDDSFETLITGQRGVMQRRASTRPKGRHSRARSSLGDFMTNRCLFPPLIGRRNSTPVLGAKGGTDGISGYGLICTASVLLPVTLMFRQRSSSPALAMLCPTPRSHRLRRYGRAGEAVGDLGQSHNKGQGH